MAQKLTFEDVKEQFNVEGHECWSFLEKYIEHCRIDLDLYVERAKIALKKGKMGRGIEEDQVFLNKLLEKFQQDNPKLMKNVWRKKDIKTTPFEKTEVPDEEGIFVLMCGVTLELNPNLHPIDAPKEVLVDAILTSLFNEMMLVEMSYALYEENDF